MDSVESQVKLDSTFELVRITVDPRTAPARQVTHRGSLSHSLEFLKSSIKIPGVASSLDVTRAISSSGTLR